MGNVYFNYVQVNMIKTVAGKMGTCSANAMKQEVPGRIFKELKFQCQVLYVLQLKTCSNYAVCKMRMLHLQQKHQYNKS